MTRFLFKCHKSAPNFFLFILKLFQHSFQKKKRNKSQQRKQNTRPFNGRVGTPKGIPKNHGFYLKGFWHQGGVSLPPPHWFSIKKKAFSSLMVRSKLAWVHPRWTAWKVKESPRVTSWVPDLFVGGRNEETKESTSLGSNEFCD